jgi:hypothetical protein
MAKNRTALAISVHERDDRAHRYGLFNSGMRCELLADRTYVRFAGPRCYTSADAFSQRRRNV